MHYADLVEVDRPELIHSVRDWEKYGAFLRVGWVGKGVDFETADADPKFLIELWSACIAPSTKFRGYNMCSLCCSDFGPLSVSFEGATAELGDGIVVVESQPGILLFAPDLVFHYVMAHRYAPPKEFVDAIMAGRHISAREEDFAIRFLRDYRPKPDCQREWEIFNRKLKQAIMAKSKGGPSQRGSRSFTSWMAGMDRDTRALIAFGALIGSFPIIYVVLEMTYGTLRPGGPAPWAVSLTRFLDDTGLSLIAFVLFLFSILVIVIAAITLMDYFLHLDDQTKEK